MKFIQIKNLLFLIFIITFLVVPGRLSARPDPEPAAFFSTLSMKDGLPSNIIIGVAQDRFGFIWIGTGSGLVRFDGYKFKVFLSGELPNSIPSNELNVVISDNDYIWVGTWGGLCKINITTFEVTRINLGDVRAIRALHKGKNNILWVGTTMGLIKYSTDNDTFQLYNTENSGLSHNMIRTLYEDSRGTMWAGTYDRLNRMDKSVNRFSILDLKGNYKPGFKNHLILDIKPASPTSDTIMWIGTETGLYRYRAGTQSFDHFGEDRTSFSNEVIKCIYPEQAGSLWLGTDFGLNVFQPKNNSNISLFHNPQRSYSIANNVVWQIMEDSGGVIWFATSNGLSRMNKFGNFYTYHEISHTVKGQPIGNQLRSVLIASDGIQWLATQHGVIRIDPQNNSWQVFDTDSDPSRRILLNNVYALEEDQRKRIWIGTAGGINIWDPRSKKMHAITANKTNGLGSNYIGKFSRSDDGTMWVSAWEGGLYRANDRDENPEKLIFEPVAGSQLGSEKHVAGHNAFWVIEYNELYKIDPQSLKKIHIPSFSRASGKQMIYCIFFSQQGKLWAGAQNGLVEYSPEKDSARLHPIRPPNEAAVISILEDREGNIWGAMNMSLLKFNATNDKVQMFPLDMNIPLKSFSYGCAAMTASHSLIFGGDNGYIILSPDKIEPNSFNPPVYITSIDINNRRIGINEETSSGKLLDKDVSFTPEMTLNYDQHSISFEFSSLHYWLPAMNGFAYKLEGFDKDWKYASGVKNFAVYSNLPAGHYTFYVKGTNNYGVESNRIATMLITIHPPLFLRPGFIVTYIILVALIVFYSLKAYATRVHLNNELKIIKMEKEHAQEIELTKERFFTNISHELRTPISLILPPIHELQKKDLDEESTQLISLAEKNSVRLLRLVNQILDFNKLESGILQRNNSRVELVTFCQEVFSLFTNQAHRNEIDFNFIAPGSTHGVSLDPEKMEAVLFNLLSNAFKFTPRGGKITLAVNLQPGYPGDFLEIIVKDSGSGISAEDKSRIFERFYQSKEGKGMNAGSGLGLTLASEYVKLHNGTIQVDSEPGKGASFIVRIPLDKEVFTVDAVQNGGTIKSNIEKSIPTPTVIDLDPVKPVILLVEDNTDLIDFLHSSLSVDYNIILAENGEEGLEKASTIVPDIMISDIMMPKMDGLTLCKKIKENTRTVHIGIILLTAKDLDRQKVEGIQTGADAYITKPFEIDLLRAHIEHLLLRKKELEDYFRNELIQQPPDTIADNNEDNRFIKQVMSIIEANISDPAFGVETISGKIGISSTHLYRRLKSLTSHSAMDIIKKYRIKKASLLLKNHEGNITEIMYEVGFSNLSYFSKCFRAEFGFTPKEYQQKAGQQTFDIGSELNTR